jgi:hypothetical protein
MKRNMILRHGSWKNGILKPEETAVAREGPIKVSVAMNKCRPKKELLETVFSIWSAQCLGYNWATLFLGDINTGTWSSRLGEPRIWDSEIRPSVPRNSDQRMTALLRASSSCNPSSPQRGRRTSANPQFSESNKIWSLAPDGAWHQDRLADWPPVVT